MKWYKNHFNFRKFQQNKSGIENLVDNLNHNLLFEKIKNEEIPFVDKFESLFFTYVLLSLEYRARRVTCMSLGFFSSNCIYIVEAYLNDIEKWIAIDIVNNTIYFNDKYIPQNLVELRLLFQEKRRIF